MFQIAAWLTLAALAAGCASRRDPEPVWVGHVAPLTGPERGRAESARRGIMLAVEEINVNREGKIHLKIRHADGARDARAETVRLLAVNRVAPVMSAANAGQIVWSAATAW